MAGTYGRGFWILDDLTALREASEDILEQDSHLFSMRNTYRLPDSELAGQCDTAIFVPQTPELFAAQSFTIPLHYIALAMAMGEFERADNG